MFNIRQNDLLFVVLLLLATLPRLQAAATQDSFESKVIHNGDFPLNYRIHVPEQLPEGEKVPLVLFLHGAAARGDDNALQLPQGAIPILEYTQSRKIPAIIVAPQCPQEMRWVDVPWDGDSHTMPAEPSLPMQAVIKLLEQCIKDYPVDTDRIYVTGLSMGGFGTWDLSQRHPEIVAAALPICGGGDTAQAGKLVNLPIWTFHGDKDTIVKTQRSRDMVAAVQAAGGQPKYTEYAGLEHRIWLPTYANPEVLDWLFAQKRPPAAN